MTLVMAEGEIKMRKGSHPATKEATFICACGNTFTATSTSKNDEIHIEVCSNCHPFYTGKQGMTTMAGNVEKFKKKYDLK